MKSTTEDSSDTNVNKDKSEEAKKLNVVLIVPASILRMVPGTKRSFVEVIAQHFDVKLNSSSSKNCFGKWSYEGNQEAIMKVIALLKLCNEIKAESQELQEFYNCLTTSSDEKFTPKLQTLKDCIKKDYESEIIDVFILAVEKALVDFETAKAETQSRKRRKGTPKKYLGDSSSSSVAIDLSKSNPLGSVFKTDADEFYSAFDQDNPDKQKCIRRAARFVTSLELEGEKLQESSQNLRPEADPISPRPLADISDDEGGQTVETTATRKEPLCSCLCGRTYITKMSRMKHFMSCDFLEKKCGQFESIYSTPTKDNNHTTPSEIMVSPLCRIDQAETESSAAFTWKDTSFDMSGNALVQNMTLYDQYLRLYPAAKPMPPIGGPVKPVGKPHPPTVNPCSSCDQVFSDRQALERHEYFQHIKPLFTCSCCKVTFATFLEFKTHTLERMKNGADKSEESYVCGECRAKFSDAVALHTHVFECHPGVEPAQHPLPLALSPARRKKRDRTRKESSTDANVSSSAAPVEAPRQKVTRVLSETEVRIRKIVTTLDNKTSKVMYACPECDRRYADMYQAKYHLDRAHLKIGKIFQCDQCCHVSYCRSHLIKHQLTHKNFAAFRCTQCDSAFKHSSSLSHHIHQHHTNKTFPCTKCTRVFSMPKLLQQHELTHRPRRFKCSQCEQTFSQRHCVARHERIHNGEKPFVCDVAECNRAFADSSTLRRHKQSHSKKDASRADRNACVAGVTDPAFAAPAKVSTRKRAKKTTTSTAQPSTSFYKGRAGISSGPGALAQLVPHPTSSGTLPPIAPALPWHSSRYNSAITHHRYPVMSPTGTSDPPAVSIVSSSTPVSTHRDHIIYSNGVPITSANATEGRVNDTMGICNTDDTNNISSILRAQSHLPSVTTPQFSFIQNEAPASFNPDQHFYHTLVIEPSLNATSSSNEHHHHQLLTPFRNEDRGMSSVQTPTILRTPNNHQLSPLRFASGHHDQSSSSNLMSSLLDIQIPPISAGVTSTGNPFSIPFVCVPVQSSPPFETRLGVVSSNNGVTAVTNSSFFPPPDSASCTLDSINISQLVVPMHHHTHTNHTLSPMPDGFDSFLSAQPDTATSLLPTGHTIAGAVIPSEPDLTFDGF